MEPHVEIYEDEGGEWRWRVKAANGEVVAQGEGHTSAHDAERAFVRATSIMMTAVSNLYEVFGAEGS